MQLNDITKRLTVKQRMKIFLVENKSTFKELSEKLGVKYYFFHNIIERKRRAPEELAKKIEAITQGLITYKELREPVGKRCPTCGHKISDK